MSIPRAELIRLLEQGAERHEADGDLIPASDLIDATLRDIKRAYLARQFRLRHGDAEGAV